MMSAPHLVLGQFLMSCRARLSSILDLPVPVEPQMYRCVERISGVISRGTPLPSTIPSFTLLPGQRRILRFYLLASENGTRISLRLPKHTISMGPAYFHTAPQAWRDAST